MIRLGAALALAAIVCACGLLPTPSGGLTARLPQSVGGQQIAYTERAASEMADQRVFLDDAIKAAGGQPETARVAVGLGPGGFTITAVQVPNRDARLMIDPVIADGGLDAASKATVEVGGKSAIVLTPSTPSPDRAYLYAAGDLLVVVTTARPSLADEALRALP